MTVLDYAHDLKERKHFHKEVLGTLRGLVILRWVIIEHLLA